MPSLALVDTDRLITDGRLRKKRRRYASRIYAQNGIHITIET